MSIDTHTFACRGCGAETIGAPETWSGWPRCRRCLTATRHRRIVLEHDGHAGWWLKFSTDMSVGPLRLERGLPGRPARLVVEMCETALDELAEQCKLTPSEAPPLHELEERMAKLETAVRGARR